MIWIHERALGALEESPSLVERIALIKMARDKALILRGSYFISRALDTFWWNILYLILFAVPEKVWFHLNRYGWRQVFVAEFDQLT